MAHSLSLSAEENALSYDVFVERTREKIAITEQPQRDSRGEAATRVFVLGLQDAHLVGVSNCSAADGLYPPLSAPEVLRCGRKQTQLPCGKKKNDAIQQKMNVSANTPARWESPAPPKYDFRSHTTTNTRPAPIAPPARWVAPG